MLLIVEISTSLIGSLGLFFNTDDQLALDDISLFLYLFTIIQSFHTCFKIVMCTSIYKLNEIWDLLDITRMNFLKSERCSEHLRILYKYKNKSKKLTNMLCIIAILIILAWLLHPLLVNILLLKSGDKKSQRYENFLNLRFPVKTKVYNNYYFLFYIIEAEMAVIHVLGVIIFDVLLISISFVIIAQNEILKESFKNLGYEKRFQNGKKEKKERKYSILDFSFIQL